MGALWFFCSSCSFFFCRSLLWRFLRLIALPRYFGWKSVQSPRTQNLLLGCHRLIKSDLSLAVLRFKYFTLDWNRDFKMVSSGKELKYWVPPPPTHWTTLGTTPQTALHTFRVRVSNFDEFQLWWMNINWCGKLNRLYSCANKRPNSGPCWLIHSVIYLV